MKYSFVTILFLALSLQLGYGQDQILPVPSNQPSPAQQKQIARKYGMFIHFGINTSMIRNGRMAQSRLLRIALQLSMPINGSKQLKMPA